MLIKLNGHSDWVSCLAFSRDDTRLASGSRDETLRIWEAPSDPTAVPLEALALGFVSNKEYDKAIELIEEATEINRLSFGDGSLEHLQSRGKLAHVESDCGQDRNGHRTVRIAYSGVD